MCVSTDPDRKRNGDCLKMAPYFVGHSSVSRRTRRVSCRPVSPRTISRGGASQSSHSRGEQEKRRRTSDVCPVDV